MNGAELKMKKEHNLSRRDLGEYKSGDMRKEKQKEIPQLGKMLTHD